MRIIEDNGQERELAQYELDALEAAREEHYSSLGIYAQYSGETQRKVLMEALANIVPLPDKEAVRMVDSFPEWAAGKPYEQGFKVRYAGRLWKVLQDHVSQADWTPDAAPSLFAKVLATDDGEIPEWEQPDSTNAYQKGDRVRRNGHVYVSTIPDNVWAPEAYPAGWEMVE